MKRLSRRQVMKVGASLFAFVPAIRYLASTPTAFAIDEECENPEYIVCVPDGTECANYDCWSYNTIYNVEMCYDERYGKTNQGICYYTYTNTGRRC